MELIQLEYLLAIDKYKSLSLAAKELKITQPALSKSMKKLENELNVSLFNRKKNKIVLNDNGLLAIKYAKKLVNYKDNMIKDLQEFDLKNTSIHIGSLAPAPLWGINHLFNHVNSLKTVESLKDNEDILIEGLYNKDYTLVILSKPYVDDNLVCQKLFEESLYLSISPGHPLALFKEISFADLNGQSVLLLNKIGFWYEICKKLLPDSHLLLQEDREVFDELTKLSALPIFRSNITILKDNVDHNRMLIPIVDDEAKLTYYAIYSKDKENLLAPILSKFNKLNWQDVKINDEFYN